MEVTLKDAVAAGSFVMSVLALYYSNDAKQQAQELDELVFRAETVSQLLKEVHTNTSTAIEPEDQMASCLYAGSLAQAEALFVQDAENRLVGKLFLDQVDRGLLPQNCVVGTLEAPDEEQVTAAVEVARTVEKAEAPRDIGQYHALIASYKPTDANCDYAKQDVSEFADLLNGQGYDGLDVYIVRTVKSNSYAVTVDAGDDRTLAQKLRGAIQATSLLSEGGTGNDSFVQVNTDWFIDPACQFAVEIG